LNAISNIVEISARIPLVKWFVSGKPNSSVRIVRVSNPDNFKSCWSLGYLGTHPLNANSLLQCINADTGRGRVGVDQVLTTWDAHAPLLHEGEGHKQGKGRNREQGVRSSEQAVNNTHRHNNFPDYKHSQDDSVQLQHNHLTIESSQLAEV
jgi:hypothetical protein